MYIIKLKIWKRNCRKEEERKQFKPNEGKVRKKKKTGKIDRKKF